MGKCFNTTGLCYPEEHYMVNIDKRLQEIEQLIGGGKYFTINRARQYGKTTTINLLEQKLSEKYCVFSISFEGIEEEVYKTAASFCQRIYGLLKDAADYGEMKGIPESIRSECEKNSICVEGTACMHNLSAFITRMCVEVEKPVVLIIDEVDQASGQEIFITFLGMLRKKFLQRKKQKTFQSVILAGIYDIKNLKLKVRSGLGHQYNSPWNIAADFNVDMKFSVSDIFGMIKEYEDDFHTGMDIKTTAEMIYEYTEGYPFLVSRICQIIDEQLPGKDEFDGRSAAWTREGVLAAVKLLLSLSSTLFDDMIKKLADFPELKNMLKNILFHGEEYAYEEGNPLINLGMMFGFLKNKNNTVAVANRIFETKLYNIFLSEDELGDLRHMVTLSDKNQFIQNGYLVL